MAAGAQLNPRVRSLEQALELPREAVRRSAETTDSVYREQERTIFASEGPGWQPLSPAYAKRKAKLRPGRKILTFDGTMRDAFSRQVSGHIVESFRLPGKGWIVRLGAQGPAWWKYHAEGGRIAGVPPIRDPQQRDPVQQLKIREAVIRALTPYVLRGLRTKLAVGLLNRGSL